MKIFHTAKCRAYPYERLNTSKGVIRSRKLPLAIAEEMTNIRRISIRKGEKQIQTNRNTWSKSQDECVLPESKENSRVLYGRKHASVAWRVDPINQENEYRALVEKRIQLEQHTESTTQTQTTPPKSAKSHPIHPLKTVKDRLNNLSPKKLEQLEHNPLAPIDQNTDEHQSEWWKTRKCIQTALRQIWYSLFNIKNKVKNLYKDPIV